MRQLLNVTILACETDVTLSDIYSITMNTSLSHHIKRVSSVGLEIPDGSSSVNPLSQALKVFSELSLEFHLGSPRPAQISLLLSELQLESAKIPMLQFERDEEEDERRKAKVTALKVRK